MGRSHTTRPQQQGPREVRITEMRSAQKPFSPNLLERFLPYYTFITIHSSYLFTLAAPRCDSCEVRFRISVLSQETEVSIDIYFTTFYSIILLASSQRLHYNIEWPIEYAASLSETRGWAFRP
jgi:hypothetical protein